MGLEFKNQAIMASYERFLACMKISLHVPEGPWDLEPNFDIFKYDGLSCVLRRSPMWVWCGYVGVGPEHPYYEKNYPDCDDLVVHGGLTCSGRDDDDPIWWFGFDCAHAGDLIPAVVSSDEIMSVRAYKTLEWARLETQKLAIQLSSVMI